MWCLKKMRRGDTLIEVLVAVVALSLVVTVCYGVMTRGFAQGQVALERTATQAMLSGQLATLRDIFTRHERAKAVSSDDADWTQLVTTYVTQTINPANLEAQLASAREACTIGSHHGFYFDFVPAAVGLSPTAPKSFPVAGGAKVRVESFPKYGDGLWVEGYRVDDGVGGANPYYIFFAKACWDAAISSERQCMVTAVRFYEAYN